LPARIASSTSRDVEERRLGRRAGQGKKREREREREKPKVEQARVEGEEIEKETSEAPRRGSSSARAAMAGGKEF